MKTGFQRALALVPILVATVARAGNDDLPPVQSIAVGDFDGDGKPDVAVGMPEVTVGKAKKAGEMRIYSGATGKFLRKVSGATAEEAYGDSIAAVGDLDGDGATDLAVTSPYGSGDSRIDLVSGRTGQTIKRIHSNPEGVQQWGSKVCALGDGSGKAKTDVLIRSVGQKCWTIYFTEMPGSGGSVDDDGGYMSDAVPVGDLDGDGMVDVALCQWSANIGAMKSAGVVRVVSGALLRRGSVDTFLLTLKGAHDHAFMGLGVAPAGDWDGDGKGDLLVGTAAEDDKKGAWLLRVVSGRDGSDLWKATGAPGDWHAAMAAMVGDVDGDGKPDVAVGAGAAGSMAGVVEVRSSKDGAALWSVKGAAKENLGDQLQPFADADGDGVADVLVVAPGSAVKGVKGAGYVRVLSGKTGAVITSINPLVAK